MRGTATCVLMPHDVGGWSIVLQVYRELCAVQGFAGVDYSTKDRSSGPVQFERDPAEAAEADPFGLDQIISEVSAHFLLHVCKGVHSASGH